MALAFTRERLMDIHVERALELVEHAAAELAPSRTLGIYCRLHMLGGAQAEVLSNRVLAKLSERLRKAAGSARPVVRVETMDDESPAAWVRRIRRRLRGRVNPELRRWVELHTGRTEVQLMREHVEGVLRALEIVGGDASIADVAELYAAAMAVRPSIGQVVYLLVLDRLAVAQSTAAAEVPILRRILSSPTPESIRIVAE